MMISELIRQNRSYRRFHEEVAIPEDDLMEMIDNARLSPSARNAQSLRYIIANTSATKANVYPCLKWAGYLAKWKGPTMGERPSAYIVILNDNDISKKIMCDHGIAAMAILLTAVEKGYGGCIVGSINKLMLRDFLNIPKRYAILQVIALGKPAETVVIENIKRNGDYKYWRDEEQVHHVPKRSLKELIVRFK